jgi:hypothetical protein
MRSSWWTNARDAELRRLESQGKSAAEIARAIGTTRNAVIGRSVRLRGLRFPSQLRRNERERKAAKCRTAEKRARQLAAVEAMRAELSWGVPREQAIGEAIASGATLQQIGDTLGITREWARQLGERYIRSAWP